jgi:membrane-associated protease RseP (regulator of RpoE activity)
LSEPSAAPPARRGPWLNAVLFVATVLSTFHVGRTLWAGAGPDAPWYAGWTFAVPLLAILLSHELGHYVAARAHRVEASLPYFIPLPFLFGTLGAIIRMRGRIEKRHALLDIGAAGPLAGMAVGLPLLVYGIATSEVRPTQPGIWLLEGHSLLYEGLLLAIHGGIPPGHDIYLNSVALAGWVGLFVTMLNLIPVGQLDGGHVAYALLGERQDRWSGRVLSLLPLLGVGVCTYYGLRGHLGGLRGWDLVGEALVGLNWLVWFGVLHLLRRLTGRAHPPVDPGELGRGRRVVALTCLALFFLIFMPVPMRSVVIPGADGQVEVPAEPASSGGVGPPRGT